MLRFLTAGESHGQALVMTIDGMPAGLTIDPECKNILRTTLPVVRARSGKEITDHDEEARKSSGT